MVFSLIGNDLAPQEGGPPSAHLLTDMLKKRKMMMENKYYPRTQEALIQNLMMKPQQTQADIALKQAHGGLLGEQQRLYGAKTQADIGAKNTAQSIQQMKMQMMTDAISRARQRETAERQQQQQNVSNGGQQQGGYQNVSYNPDESSMGQGEYNQFPNDLGAYNISFDKNTTQHKASQKVAETLRNNNPMTAYGVTLPQPSSDDLLNKAAFGIDSYGERLKQARENQQIQQKEFMERSVENNNQANMSNDYMQKLNRFNYLMDNSLLSGSLGSKVPGSSLSTTSQEIDALSKEMHTQSIQYLKHAMGNARFTNLDVNLATAMTPTRTWNKETRHFYTDFFKEINSRLNDKAKFYSLVANPKMGISSTMADALWRSYQDHHPIVKSAEDKKLNHYEDKNWITYLTPEAIKAVQTKGDYNPKDKGIKPNYSLEQLHAEMERRKKLKRV